MFCRALLSVAGRRQLLRYTEYGVEVGSVEETYIFQAIKERMHRHR